MDQAEELKKLHEVIEHRQENTISELKKRLQIVCQQHQNDFNKLDEVSNELRAAETRLQACRCLNNVQGTLRHNKGHFRGQRNKHIHPSNRK